MQGLQLVVGAGDFHVLEPMHFGVVAGSRHFKLHPQRAQLAVGVGVELGPLGSVIGLVVVQGGRCPAGRLVQFAQAQVRARRVVAAAGEFGQGQRPLERGLRRSAFATDSRWRCRFLQLMPMLLSTLMQASSSCAASNSASTW